jgi:ABC-2 type transport system ATP-binding protein
MRDERPVSAAIVVDGLVRRFGAFTALHGVSFEIPAGQVTALLGRNGAGKTTTIEILEGFQSPTAGTVRVLGADPRQGSRSWRARIGLVLQSTALDAQVTVAEALTLFGGVYPKPRPVAEVLDAIELSDDAGTRIGALSGGQKRRVDLGIAIIGRPEMLFLDEPTTGLDPEVRRRIWQIIGDLTAEGTSVLLATHYMDEAQYLASRVIVLGDGRVIADTTPARMRAMGGTPVINFQPPADAPPLPAGFPSSDLTQDLQILVTWAREHNVDLTGLEVGPPSLEDAYLALTGANLDPEVPCGH